MATTSFIDACHLCWDAILMESKEYKNVLFNEKHCTPEDTRDTNFDKVENRLAYMHQHGCFNILFVEKCIANFLDEYSEAEKFFSRENLKICSLSNGPGLDLIGLLNALYKSSKCSIKCFPILKTINLYDSWLSIFKRMVTTVHQVTSSSFYDYFHIPSETIHLIQSDIYSTISPEAEECIKDSDILLMVKVFASTKASPQVVSKSIQEIFLLLKPGALVFYVGSKKNTKELSANSSLSNFVNYILGPTKITLEDLPVDKGVVKTVGIKPKESGYAYFIVWQKKDTDEITEKKKKRTRKNRKKSKVKPGQRELTDGNAVTNEFRDDTDAGSEISFTSSSKQSSNEIKTVSNENIFQPDASIEINAKNCVGEEQNLAQKDLSLSSVTSPLDKINVQHSNNEEENVKDTQQNILESGNGSISDLERNIQEKEFETCIVKQEVFTQIKNNDSCHEIGVKQTEILQNQEFLQQIKNKETIPGKFSQNKMPQFYKDDICDKVNSNNMSNNGSFVNKLFQTSAFPSVIQNITNKELGENVCNKMLKVPKDEMQSVNEGRVIPTELNIENKNDKKGSNTINQSTENVFQFKRNVMTVEEAKSQEVCDRDKLEFHSLLQRCESLVTSLEKLTVNFQKSITPLNNDQNFKCCIPCTKFRNTHSCVSPCSINTIQSGCRKACNCQMIQNNNCTTCTKSLPHRTSVYEISEYTFKKSANVSTPHIVIPVQNKDILQILASKKS